MQQLQCEAPAWAWATWFNPCEICPSALTFPPGFHGDGWAIFLFLTANLLKRGEHKWKCATTLTTIYFFYLIKKICPVLETNSRDHTDDKQILAMVVLLILSVQQRASFVYLSFNETSQIVFGSSEVNGIAHSGVDKLQWHQSSWVLPKLQLEGFPTVKLRVKINISQMCLTLQANLFEVGKLWLGCVSHLNCTSTEMKKKKKITMTSSAADLPHISACAVTVQ